jgi:hypothetical protein
VIAGGVEAPYARRPLAGTSIETLLADAFCRALEAGGIERRDVYRYGACANACVLAASA